MTNAGSIPGSKGGELNPQALLACVGALGVLGLGAVVWASSHMAVYAALVGTSGVALFLFSLRREFRQDMAARALLGTFLTPIVAWVLPHVLLLFLVMCFWVPAMAGRRDRIAGVYLCCMLLLPALDVPIAIGSLKLVAFNVQDGLVLGSAFAIARNPVRHPGRFIADRWVIALLVLFTVVFGRDTSSTNLLRVACSVVLNLGLPYYVLSRGIANATELRTTIRWFACGGVALAALMLFEAVRAWSLYNELYQHYGLPNMFYLKVRGGIVRAAGPFMESTSAALVLALSLAGMWLLRADFRSRLRHYALAAVMFLGMSVPQSRGAWMGVLVGWLLVDLYRRDYAALARRCMVMGLLAAVVLALASLSPTFANAVGFSPGSADTAEYRKQLFQRGMEQIRLRPFTGYSMPQLDVVMADMRQGEGIVDYVNSFIWVALVSGIGGLALFCGSFMAPMIQSWTRCRDWALAQGRDAGAFLFAGLAMLIVMFAFTSFGARPASVTFAMFGFACALRGIEIRSRTAREAEPLLPSLAQVAPAAAVPLAETAPRARSRDQAASISL
ncbi:O-antigen ligase family protein [Novosphingobium sp. BL-8H]|uniref:O-antigen ligase family protein n=1 Tax=Novosphingobium sp. BL-8H TaxID=3127640 RepID=UPI0037566A30